MNKISPIDIGVPPTHTQHLIRKMQHENKLANEIVSLHRMANKSVHLLHIHMQTYTYIHACADIRVHEEHCMAFPKLFGLF